MRKYLLFFTLVCISFYSCQKNVALNAPQQFPEIASNAAHATSSSGDIIFKDDLTGVPIQNECTGEIMTALSGDAVGNLAPDGVTLRSLTIHNFVFESADGTIYHNNYVITFELIGTDGYINTYKMISNPQGGGMHLVLHGELKVNNSDVQFDKFVMKCN